jgi:predicted Zn finger-like uncharacterized protein
MIRITCESCGTKYQVPDAVAGKTTRCTKCHQLILIPPLGAQAAAPTTASPPAPGVSPARPAAPVPPSAPAPAPRGDSAADALAALTQASRAAAPAASPRARAATPHPTSSTRTSEPLPEAPDFEAPIAAPRKSHAALIAGIVISAVLVTLVGGILVYVLVIYPKNQAKMREDSDIRAVQADVDGAKEQAKGALSDPSQIEQLDPAGLDEARGKLAAAKAKQDEVISKVQHLNLQGEIGKSLLTGLQDSQKKIAQNIERIDAALWPGPGTPQEMFERVRPSVPQIIIPGPPGTPFTSSGSGFLLESDGKWCVATNRHVVTEGKDGLTVIFRIGDLQNPTPIEIKVPPSAVTRIHRATDLAVIDLSNKDVELLQKNKIRPLPLNPPDDKDKPKPGEDCWLVGHPGGGDEGSTGGIQTNTFGSGSVAKVQDMEGFAECVEISAPVNHGNSGGPVFNKFGRVIGQATFSRKDADRQNYAVSVNMLRGLLDTQDNWSVDSEEIHRILAPQEALAAEHDRVAKDMGKQGFVECPVNAQQPLDKYFVNTIVDAVPLLVNSQTPYKVVVITGKSATLHLMLALNRQGSMPILKNRSVEQAMDIPMGPGNYALYIGNEHPGLRTPCIVALFKKK